MKRIRANKSGLTEGGVVAAEVRRTRGRGMARTSRWKIAAGVRGDNWSEGRLRCKWTNSWTPYINSPAMKEENLPSDVFRPGRRTDGDVSANLRPSGGNRIREI